MRIPEDEIREAVAIWGYTPREARFLWVVTAFGGHFVRQQYSRFIQAEDHGGNEQELCDKLLHNGHAPAAWKWGRDHKAFRYHVQARALYRVFGRENSSHRKAPTSNATIAVRIAALDFVLGEPDAHYLLTEEERLSYLREGHGVADPDLIPSRRYPPRGKRGTTPEVSVLFPDRFPMSVAHGGTPTFSYIDAPDDGLSPFETHVSRYAPLLRALRTPCRFVFVSGSGPKTSRAEEVFRRALASPKDELTPELLRFFALEDRYLRKDFAGLRKRDYDDHADLARSFAAPQYRKLFERWRSVRNAAPSVEVGPSHPILFTTADAPSLRW